MQLPFLTHDLPSMGGRMRVMPEDFVVHELPAYLPTGEGDHTYVRFEKRGITTKDAIARIAKALGCNARECGWAGLKDKHGVTEQWASFFKADVDRALGLTLDGITVREAKRHRNKLKVGHTHGNRFVLRVRDCADNSLAVAEQVAQRLRAQGVPNYYGPQRFGRDGDNAVRAIRWLTGASDAPRDGFLRKMLASSLQSHLFNQYVAERLSDGLLGTYVEGDLAVRFPLDRVFVISAEEAVTAYGSLECSATGPMFGPDMRWPTGAAKVREEQLLARSALTLEHFANAGGLAQGTRRAVRMVAQDLRVIDEGGGCVRVEFSLPAGGYATVVLREFRKTDDEDRAEPSEEPSEGP
jgi:tRNA pseudouridine13 synthase